MIESGIIYIILYYYNIVVLDLNNYNCNVITAAVIGRYLFGRVFFLEHVLFMFNNAIVRSATLIELM